MDDKTEDAIVATPQSQIKGVNRTLAEIIQDLSKRVPDHLLSKVPHKWFEAQKEARDREFRECRKRHYPLDLLPYDVPHKYIPWYNAVRVLNHYAPGWIGEIRNIAVPGKSANTFVTVVYRVTLKGSDGEVCREASATSTMDYSRRRRSWSFDSTKSSDDVSTEDDDIVNVEFDSSKSLISGSSKVASDSYDSNTSPDGYNSGRAKRQKLGHLGSEETSEESEDASTDEDDNGHELYGDMGNVQSIQHPSSNSSQMLPSTFGSLAVSHTTSYAPPSLPDGTRVPSETWVPSAFPSLTPSQLSAHAKQYKKLKRTFMKSQKAERDLEASYKTSINDKGTKEPTEDAWELLNLTSGILSIESSGVIPANSPSEPAVIETSTDSDEGDMRESKAKAKASPKSRNRERRKRSSPLFTEEKEKKSAESPSTRDFTPRNDAIERKTDRRSSSSRVTTGHSMPSSMEDNIGREQTPQASLLAQASQKMSEAVQSDSPDVESEIKVPRRKMKLSINDDRPETPETFVSTNEEFDTENIAASQRMDMVKRSKEELIHSKRRVRARRGPIRKKKIPAISVAEASGNMKLPIDKHEAKKLSNSERKGRRREKKFLFINEQAKITAVADYSDTDEVSSTPEFSSAQSYISSSKDSDTETDVTQRKRYKKMKPSKVFRHRTKTSELKVDVTSKKMSEVNLEGSDSQRLDSDSKERHVRKQEHFTEGDRTSRNIKLVGRTEVEQQQDVTQEYLQIQKNLSGGKMKTLEDRDDMASGVTNVLSGRKHISSMQKLYRKRKVYEEHEKTPDVKADDHTQGVNLVETTMVKKLRPNKHVYKKGSYRKKMFNKNIGVTSKKKNEGEGVDAEHLDIEKLDVLKGADQKELDTSNAVSDSKPSETVALYSEGLKSSPIVASENMKVVEGSEVEQRDEKKIDPEGTEGQEDKKIFGTKVDMPSLNFGIVESVELEQTDLKQLDLQNKVHPEEFKSFIVGDEILSGETYKLETNVHGPIYPLQRMSVTDSKEIKTSVDKTLNDEKDTVQNGSKSSHMKVDGTPQTLMTTEISDPKRSIIKEVTLNSTPSQEKRKEVMIDDGTEEKSICASSSEKFGIQSEVSTLGMDTVESTRIYPEKKKVFDQEMKTFTSDDQSSIDESYISANDGFETGQKLGEAKYSEADYEGKKEDHEFSSEDFEFERLKATRRPKSSKPSAIGADEKKVHKRKKKLSIIGPENKQDKNNDTSDEFVEHEENTAQLGTDLSRSATKNMNKKVRPKHISSNKIVSLKKIMTVSKKLQRDRQEKENNNAEDSMETIGIDVNVEKGSEKLDKKVVISEDAVYGKPVLSETREEQGLQSPNKMQRSKDILLEKKEQRDPINPEPKLEHVSKLVIAKRSKDGRKSPKEHLRYEKTKKIQKRENAILNHNQTSYESSIKGTTVEKSREHVETEKKEKQIFHNSHQVGFKDIGTDMRESQKNIHADASSSVSTAKIDNHEKDNIKSGANMNDAVEDSRSIKEEQDADTGSSSQAIHTMNLELGDKANESFAREFQDDILNSDGSSDIFYDVSSTKDSDEALSRLLSARNSEITEGIVRKDLSTDPDPSIKEYTSAQEVGTHEQFGGDSGVLHDEPSTKNRLDGTLSKPPSGENFEISEDIRRRRLSMDPSPFTEEYIRSHEVPLSGGNSEIIDDMGQRILSIELDPSGKQMASVQEVATHVKTGEDSEIFYDGPLATDEVDGTLSIPLKRENSEITEDINQKHISADPYPSIKEHTSDHEVATHQNSSGKSSGDFDIFYGVPSNKDGLNGTLSKSLLGDNSLITEDISQRSLSTNPDTSVTEYTRHQEVVTHERSGEDSNIPYNGPSTKDGMNGMISRPLLKENSENTVEISRRNLSLGTDPFIKEYLVIETEERLYPKDLSSETDIWSNMYSASSSLETSISGSMTPFNPETETEGLVKGSKTEIVTIFPATTSESEHVTPSLVHPMEGLRPYFDYAENIAKASTIQVEDMRTYDISQEVIRKTFTIEMDEEQVPGSNLDRELAASMTISSPTCDNSIRNLRPTENLSSEFGKLESMSEVPKSSSASKTSINLESCPIEMVMHLNLESGSDERRTTRLTMESDILDTVSINDRKLSEMRIFAAKVHPADNSRTKNEDELLKTDTTGRSMIDRSELETNKRPVIDLTKDRMTIVSTSTSNSDYAFSTSTASRSKDASLQTNCGEERIQKTDGPSFGLKNSNTYKDKVARISTSDPAMKGKMAELLRYKTYNSGVPLSSSALEVEFGPPRASYSSQDGMDSQQTSGYDCCGLRRLTPLTLGLEIAGGIMTVVIPRNTPIPIQRKQLITTHIDNQTELEFHIFEGERFWVQDNEILGSFEIKGIPPAPRGEPALAVYFDIDKNGILNVLLEEEKLFGGKSMKTITLGISNVSVRPDRKKILEMIQDAEKHKVEDEEDRRTIELKNSFEHYVYQMRNIINDKRLEKVLDPKEKAEMVAAVQTALNWLFGRNWFLYNQRQVAEFYDVDAQKRELQSICDPIIEKMFRSL